jgi:signal transduction histidine kinase
LSVADRGEGIPTADLPHIFERFRRGRNVEGRFPGTGIGLAGVHRIIELHQGTISVETQIGEGTRFTIRLPLDPPSPSVRGPIKGVGG